MTEDQLSFIVKKKKSSYNFSDYGQWVKGNNKGFKKILQQSNISQELLYFFWYSLHVRLVNASKQTSLKQILATTLREPTHLILAPTNEYKYPDERPPLCKVIQPHQMTQNSEKFHS